ncbi:DUF378 domain-containing protein [Candidatus Pacebacteria bacterium]|nr:DUF378 domain-containing protein [Candidatus Paceibacterota bacterium]
MYAVALILTAIGSLNWGLVALLDLNLVTAIFGDSILTTIVYIAVALSAVYVLVKHFTGGAHSAATVD